MNLKKKDLIELKNEIKRLAVSGRACAQEARSCSGKERHLTHLEKRCVGQRTRQHLLAYAFLRSFPYNRVEVKCERKPDLDLWLIYKFASKFAPHEMNITLQQIRDWLKGIQSRQEVAA